MKNLHYATYTLLVLGGLNWLLLGVFGWEIGSLFGGSSALVSKVIYILIGLSAVYEVANHKNCCKNCSAPKNKSSAPESPAAPASPEGSESSENQ